MLQLLGYHYHTRQHACRARGLLQHTHKNVSACARLRAEPCSRSPTSHITLCTVAAAVATPHSHSWKAHGTSMHSTNSPIQKVTLRQLTLLCLRAACTVPHSSSSEQSPPTSEAHRLVRARARVQFATVKSASVNCCLKACSTFGSWRFAAVDVLAAVKIVPLTGVAAAVEQAPASAAASLSVYSFRELCSLTSREERRLLLMSGCTVLSAVSSSCLMSAFVLSLAAVKPFLSCERGSAPAASSACGVHSKVQFIQLLAPD
jgi:hypothetical protein